MFLNGEYYWFSNETGRKYRGRNTGNVQVRCGLSALVVRFAGLSPPFPVKNTKKSISSTHFSIPVSYTHLDVYKRQVLPYFTISGKVFYRTKDVHEFIRTRFAEVEERAAKRKEKEARKAERRRKRGLFP